MESEKESMRVIDDARDYVIENLEVLKRAYEHDYIAVRKGVVLGNDKDEFKLAGEMELKFRDFAVLIGTIDDIINPRGVEFSSPEVNR